jgi:hypothetical protein
MATDKGTITAAELAELDADELAERFKAGDLELCVEPLSEWGSELEGLFQKLEKSVMQWYEAGLKRSFTICFLDEATAPTPETATEEKETTQNATPLTAPALAS